MKYNYLICLFLVAFLFSCRKPEDSPAPSSIIKGKKWKLISYNLNGTEIIGGFSDCVLDFNNDGTLLIMNAGKNNIGSWIEFSEPAKIEMNVTSNDPYVNLFNKTWETVFLNPGRIQLADQKINPQEIIKLDILR
jgi:hypothetical protein